MWLFVLAGLLIPAFWFAGQTRLSMIDDVLCATTLGAHGNHGWLSFLRTVFTSPDITRFRWLYELEQNARWLMLGSNLGAHHVVMLGYRCVTAFLACRIVHEYATRTLGNCPFEAKLATIAYGLFFPVVPESRIGLQEPLFSLLMLALMLTIGTHHASNGVPGSRSRGRWPMLGLAILLSGTKEPAVPVAGWLTLLACLEFRQASRKEWAGYIGCLLLLAYSVIRVLVVARNDNYSHAQGDLEAFNAGWLYYRLRQTGEVLLLMPTELSWLSVGSGVLLLAGGLELLRGSLGRRSRGVALMILTTFGLLLMLTAKMKFVLRYGEPLYWLAAVIAGIGLSRMLMSVRVVWGRRLIGGVVAGLLLAGNYLPFLSQFAAQAVARSLDDQYFQAVSDHADREDVPQLFLYGNSPNHDLGPRRNEFGTISKLYLELYRPMFRGLASIRTRPIEESSRARPGDFLIGMARSEELAAELPELELTLVTALPTDGEPRLTAAFDAFVRAFRRVGLEPKLAWVDAGSPERVTNRRDAGIWRIERIHRSVVPRGGDKEARDAN